MTKKSLKVPYEAPDLWIKVTEFESVICTSWVDGEIPDDNYNSFDLD